MKHDHEDEEKMALKSTGLTTPDKLWDGTRGKWPEKLRVSQPLINYGM